MLQEHDAEQIVLGSGCGRAMMAELGPLLGQLVHVGDEVAVGDDAANVIVTRVPVDWPGYWISGHIFLLCLEKKGIVVGCEECRSRGYW